MKVIIVRHAETNENAQQIEIGNESEVLLNDEGVKQAEKLANRLKGEKILYAYVSPQKRAVQTASEILKHHSSAKMIHTHQLKEQNLGIYEGVKKHIWKEIKANSKEPFHSFKPEEGESYAELQERVAEFFKELYAKHKNDTVIIISHAGTIGMLLLYLFGEPITIENYKKYRPENAAVTVLEINENQPHHVHFVNDLVHLK